MVEEVNNLSATMEDYLETILELKNADSFARVGKIAAKLNVKSPSVNSALKYLSNQKLVIHEKYGYVKLTAAGEKTASDVKNKHEILFRFLTEFLMLDPAEAEKEACYIEHTISRKTFVRLTQFFKFLESDFTTEKSKMLQLFAEYLKTGGKKIKCSCAKYSR